MSPGFFGLLVMNIDTWVCSSKSSNVWSAGAGVDVSCAGLMWKLSFEATYQMVSVIPLCQDDWQPVAAHCGYHLIFLFVCNEPWVTKQLHLSTIRICKCRRLETLLPLWEVKSCIIASSVCASRIKADKTSICSHIKQGRHWLWITKQQKELNQTWTWRQYKLSGHWVKQMGTSIGLL